MKKALSCSILLLSFLLLSTQALAARIMSEPKKLKHYESKPFTITKILPPVKRGSLEKMFSSKKGEYMRLRISAVEVDEVFTVDVDDVSGFDAGDIIRIDKDRNIIKLTGEEAGKYNRKETAEKPSVAGMYKAMEAAQTEKGTNCCLAEYYTLKLFKGEVRESGTLRETLNMEIRQSYCEEKIKVWTRDEQGVRRISEGIAKRRPKDDCCNVQFGYRESVDSLQASGMFCLEERAGGIFGNGTYTRVTSKGENFSGRWTAYRLVR